MTFLHLALVKAFDLWLCASQLPPLVYALQNVNLLTRVQKDI